MCHDCEDPKPDQADKNRQQLEAEAETLRRQLLAPESVDDVRAGIQERRKTYYGWRHKRLHSGAEVFLAWARQDLRILWHSLAGIPDATTPPPFKEPSDLDEAIFQLSEVERWCNDQAQRSGVMTEPLTKQELAKWFHCSRNRVNELVLSKYPYEKVGNRYRLPARIMPAGYHAARHLG